KQQAFARDFMLAERWVEALKLAQQRGPGTLIERAPVLAGVLGEPGNGTSDQRVVVGHDRSGTPHAGPIAARLWAKKAASSGALGSPRPIHAGCPPGPQALPFERVLDKDRVLPLRARRKQRYRAADEFLDPAYILDGLGGQFGPRPRARR